MEHKRDHHQWMRRVLGHGLAGMLVVPAAGLWSMTPSVQAEVVLAQRADAARAEATAGQAFEDCDQDLDAQRHADALGSCRQAVEDYRAVRDRQGEADALLNLGLVHWRLSDYDRAISMFEAALPVFREVKDRNSEARVLNNLGLVYRALSQYERSIRFYEQALPIFQTLGDRFREASVLGNLGSAYWSLSEYERAISYYKQVLPMFRELGDRNREAKILWGLGLSHGSLAQYEQEIDFYQQALPLLRAAKDHSSAANVLMLLGVAHGNLDQQARAIAFYEQALPIFQSIQDRNGEARALNNLGLAYRQLSQFERAITFYEQALPIFQAVKDRNGEAQVLNNLGVIYRHRLDYERAQTAYQHALAISRAIKDREGEGRLLSNLGYLSVQQRQPELAIVFFKQAVNVLETIRAGLRPLSADLQTSYADSIAVTYRRLADLLLEQGRILEAQQVLELLKVQEIRDFNQDTRVGAQVPGIPLSPTEQAILAKFGSLIAFGQQLEACRQTHCPQLDQLSAQRTALAQQYHQTVDRFRQELNQRQANDEGFFDPELLGDAQAVVEQTQAKTNAKTILIYPLVLNQKLWLLWVAPGGVVNSRPVEVSQAQLGQAVLTFRRQMQTCELRPCTTADTAQLQQVSRQLYDWLIRPLDAELVENQIQNLVFALDRTVRYIPMAALYDGQQYLVQKYTLSTILSAALTDTSDRLPFGPSATQILGMGLSEAVAGFNPLQYVRTELDQIVRQDPASRGIYPGQTFFNQAFNATALTGQLERRQHRIVHIATHGQFVPGNYLASFLLLGDGRKLSIEQIRTLPLMSQVDLVVLSACESALGGADTLDGVEIASMSYYFLTRKVKTVLASLWQVNDASTSQLMQKFYEHLAQDSAAVTVTKAEALQAAQLQFIRQQVTAPEGQGRATIRLTPTDGGRSATGATKDLSHPYYWAPFILIGNGL